MLSGAAEGVGGRGGRAAEVWPMWIYPRTRVKARKLRFCGFWLLTLADALPRRSRCACGLSSIRVHRKRPLFRRRARSDDFVAPGRARGRGAENGQEATRRPRAAFPRSLALLELWYRPVRLVYAYIRAEQKRFRESVVNLVKARVRPERNFRRGNVHEGA